MNPGWPAYVHAGTDRLFLTRLGPEISSDARDLCPVLGGQHSTASATSIAIAERKGVTPGSLRDSIRFFLRVHKLIVMATGSDERSYAAYIELGHRVVAFGRDMGYSKGPQPFLRPSLYTVRGA